LVGRPIQKKNFFIIPLEKKKKEKEKEET